MWVIFVFLFIFLMRLYFKLFKIPKLGNVTLVTGGVKAGKSTLSVHMAIKRYKSHLIAYYIRKFFKSKKTVVEKPLLYSNVPLKVDYVPLTEDLILRKKRFAYGSVIYIQEASLLADSMNFKDDDTNDALRLFNKLIAHETLGGEIIYDTQSVSDLHFGIKRNLNSYLYVHHTVKSLPFFVIAYVRELMYSADNENINNSFNDDVETGLRRILIPKSVWKKFDYTTFSGLTDHLPVESTLVQGSKLKDLKSTSYLHLEKKQNTYVRRSYNGK